MCFDDIDLIIFWEQKKIVLIIFIHVIMQM